MFRNRTQVIMALAILALVLVTTAPTLAEFPRNKCFLGVLQIRIDDALFQCPDIMWFGTTNFNSLCFGDNGPYNVTDQNAVIYIEFDRLNIPPGSELEGGPFSGRLNIDRNGAGSAMAGVFHGRATYGMDLDGPGPSNGSFYGLQLNCGTPAKPETGTLGEWQSVTP